MVMIIIVYIAVGHTYIHTYITWDNFICTMGSIDVAVSIYLIGGLEHFYFPFHIWDVILPIDELIFFKMGTLHHQPVIFK